VNSQMIKAIIFDMDGVLIDAKEWHYEALNRALALFGFKISRYAHLTTYDGLPTKKKLEMLSVEQCLPDALFDFINDMKQQYTLELVSTQCRPRFIHEYAISSLKARGYKLAVCSNSIRQSVDIMLSRANLLSQFDLTLSSEDVTCPKPDPEIYNKAIARLGLSPMECLIIEDNENGIKAARASGAHLLTVKTVDEVNLNNILRQIQECQ